MFDKDSLGLQRRLSMKHYVFDENNHNFYPNDEYNTFFILRTQQYFNDLLKVQGFVFLNDVLKALGIAPRMIGQIAGWRFPGGTGFIEIKITQRGMRHGKPFEYFLEIVHDGIIVFDVMGD